MKSCKSKIDNNSLCLLYTCSCPKLMFSSHFHDLNKNHIPSPQRRTIDIDEKEQIQEFFVHISSIFTQRKHDRKLISYGDL